MLLKRALLLIAIWATTFTQAGCSAEAAGTVAFLNVRLVPMTSKIVLENQVVVVEGSAIAAVGAAGDIQIPDGARIIDADGAYLMPGLADMHVHTRQDWDDPAVWPVHPLHMYLANGVTTIRDFGPQGDDLTYAPHWQEEIRAGARMGPAIYTSGKILFASPLEDPQALVQRNHDLGFDFLKLYSYLNPEDFRAALDAAAELDMYTAGHIPYEVGLQEAINAGMDEIAHVEELLPEFIDFDRHSQLRPDEWLADITARMTGEGKFGAIEPGNRADLILVNGNPLHDVGVIRQPLGVMAAGRWFSQGALEELLKPRGPLAAEE